MFALDRSLRLLFPLDLEEQKRKVIRMLGAAIYGLSTRDRRSVRQRARRRVDARP
jgi:hypothetical protein